MREKRLVFFWALALLLISVAAERGRPEVKQEWLSEASARQKSLLDRGWILHWADEFNGDTVDVLNWSIQEGDGCAEGICGWGNEESQIYESNAVEVSGGTLGIHITPTGNGGLSSGRLHTHGKVESMYGRIEARILLPQGQGLWPAFWALPANETDYGPWAASGEIDIMESFGQMDKVYSTLHFGGSWPDNWDSVRWPQMTSFACPGGGWCVARRSWGKNFASSYHIFSLEWTETEIRWFVDDEMFCRKTDWFSSGAPFPAPYNQPFYLILNVAVGGGLPGEPDINCLPQEMRVDWVRWYRRRDNQGVDENEIGNVKLGTCGSLLGDALIDNNALTIWRGLLLFFIPALCICYFAATGLDGVPLLSAGWNVCSFGMSVSCNGGSLASGSLIRESIVYAAVMQLPCALILLARVGNKHSMRLALGFVVPAAGGLLLGASLGVQFLPPMFIIRPSIAVIGLLAALFSTRFSQGWRVGHPFLVAATVSAAGFTSGLAQGYAGCGGVLALSFMVIFPVTKNRWRAAGAAVLFLMSLPRSFYLYSTIAREGLFMRPGVLCLVSLGSILGYGVGNFASDAHLTDASHYFLSLCSLIALSSIMLLCFGCDWDSDPTLSFVSFWCIMSILYIVRRYRRSTRMEYAIIRKQLDEDEGVRYGSTAEDVDTFIAWDGSPDGAQHHHHLRSSRNSSMELHEEHLTS
jgi:beta-glucanase (GH16 family)